MLHGEPMTLDNVAHDTILWKFTSHGEYSASTAYMAQFAGHTTSIMPAAVWKGWAPPKCKFFAWLIIQNRVWTADRLHRRGWPNCNLCPLCKQVQETAAHLLFQCRFSQRVWIEVATWLGIHGDVVRSWRNEASGDRASRSEKGYRLPVHAHVLGDLERA